MSPRHQSQADAVADRAYLLRALTDHRHGIRLFLALFAAHRAQINTAEEVVWRAWLATPAIASATGVRVGLQRLAVDAIARQLDLSAAGAITGRDPLIHVLSQSGLETLQRPSGIDAGIAHHVQARLAALDPELQRLLQGRYHHRQSTAALAEQFGWSTARVDARLVWARSALDWTTATATANSPVESAPEGLLITLMEDQIAGTIDADSRALVSKRMIDDVSFAMRLARQARVDLVLGELLAPVLSVELDALADRLLGNSHEIADQRSATGGNRRSGVLPAAARRRRPVPAPLIGGILAGVAAVVVVAMMMARPAATNVSHTSSTLSVGTQNERPEVPVRTPAEPSRTTTAPTVAPSMIPPPSPALASVISAPGATPAVAGTTPTVNPSVAPVALAVPVAETVAAPVVPLAVASAVPVTPVMLTSSIPPARTTTVAKPVFVKGIHFGSEAVTIDGDRWQAQKQAEEDGLTLRNARRVMVSLAPIPAVDADTRSLLISGIAATKSEPLGIGLALPDGDYDVAVWVMENQRANSRLFDLDIGGVALTNLGDLPFGGWAKYGPCAVQVRGGKLEITSKAQRGTPMLMGLTIHRTSESIAAEAKGAKTYVADFSAGVAKDWNPVSGAWSVAAGNYIHTSADGIHLSMYEGATWGDLTYSASLFPRYDNAYGLVFGFQDAQTYDVLTIVKEVATLQRVTKGVTIQVAQAACQATSKWKWSTALVTRVERRVSVSINQSPVFTDVDLGEAAAGKIGLYTAFCQADFGAISVTLPHR